MSATNFGIVSLLLLQIFLLFYLLFLFLLAFQLCTRYTLWSCPTVLGYSVIFLFFALQFRKFLSTYLQVHWFFTMSSLLMCPSRDSFTEFFLFWAFSFDYFLVSISHLTLLIYFWMLSNYMLIMVILNSLIILRCLSYLSLILMFALSLQVTIFLSFQQALWFLLKLRHDARLKAFSMRFYINLAGTWAVFNFSNSCRCQRLQCPLVSFLLAPLCLSFS